MDLLRVPGQGALPALRHPRLRGAAGDDAGGGARGGRGARRAGRRQGAGADRRPRQGGRHQARRRPGGRRAEGAARSSASTSAATSSRRSGSSRPPRSRRSTTSRSRSTGARRSRSSCSRPQGGVEIEEVAANDPDALVRLHVDAARGLPAVDRAAPRLRRAGRGSGRAEADRGDHRASSTAASSSRDAMLCEINPLIVTPEGEVKALDSKFTVDDSALYRHPDIAELRDTSAADPLESFAREKGVTYVKLDGSVGILGNGAGLSMSTVDVVVVAGGRPANFCDLGGGGSAEGVVDALEVITRDPQVQVDLLQHLRRDHALRRGRARHPGGARAHGDHACRSSCASTARTRRRAGRSSPTPRRRTCTSSRRCSTPPRGRGAGGMSEPSGASARSCTGRARRTCAAPTST